MSSPLLRFNGRSIVFRSPGATLPNELVAPFAVLLPAFSEAERREVEKLFGAILDRGCIEACCVGPESEGLHDTLDQVIEDRGALDVVTTWHTDLTEACEYFVIVAGGGLRSLLVLTTSHADLTELVKQTARRQVPNRE